MIRFTKADGSTQVFKSTTFAVQDKGILFYNEQDDMRQIMTFDKFTKVEFRLDVDEAMAKNSLRLQGNLSDKVRAKVRPGTTATS